MKNRPVWYVRAVLAGALLAILCAALPRIPGFTGPLQRFENTLFGARLDLTRDRDRLPLHKVVVVGLDHRFRERAGYSRDALAQILAAIGEADPEIVGVDLLMFSPDADPARDQRLAAVLEEVDCVLGTDFQDGLTPTEALRAMEVSEGFVNLTPAAEDGVVRRFPMWHLREDGRFTLPIALELVVQKQLRGEVPTLDRQDEFLQIGDLRYPHIGGFFWPRWNGTPIPMLSAADILAGGHRDELKGAIVLVGSAVKYEHDDFIVPFSPQRRAGRVVESNLRYGVEIHAWAVRAFLEDDLFRAPAPWLAWAWILAAPVLFWGLGFGLGLKPAQHLLVSALTAVLLVGGNLLAFRSGLILPLAGPLVSMLAVGGAGIFFRSALEVWSKRQVEGMFGRYLSPNVVGTLLKNPHFIRLGGRRERLTVMFSDLRGFTPLSEKMAPEALSAQLNEYFTSMVEILFSHGGTLDKFIGDALMAFFGDPVPQEDHAARALRTAVAMQARLVELRAKWEKEGRPPMHAGIGINTGDVIVGNQGAERIFAYTVIGDAVNLAARLESNAPKDHILVSMSAYDALGERAAEFLWEAKEPIKVKGKAEPVPIMLCLGLAPSPQNLPIPEN